MIFLKLNEYRKSHDSTQLTRVNAQHIKVYKEYGKGSRLVFSDEENDRYVTETPEQIDEMIDDAATLRNACVVSARIKP